MEPTRTAYGTWSGGRFLPFGQPLDDDRFVHAIQHAYQHGVRTFITADAFGNGAADTLLGLALSGYARSNYCLVGAIGHDFYEGEFDGTQGYPRFTHSALRAPEAYADYLRMATEQSLTRCRADKFDLLLLHNPDSIGFSSDAVWKGLQKIRDAGLANHIGIAPGPGNGFTLDLIQCFERFEGLVEWAMIILSPLSPWPGRMCLPAAVEHRVKVITRGVDHAGLFHDDIKAGDEFGQDDPRGKLLPGWLKSGNEKLDEMRSYADAYQLTMLQLACLWNLSNPAVTTVVPTIARETCPQAKSIELKLEELAALSSDPRLQRFQLSSEDNRTLLEIGNNKGSFIPKGGRSRHCGPRLEDQWRLTSALRALARRWGIDLKHDLALNLQITPHQPISIPLPTCPGLPLY